jgi:hypothetical protein
MKVYTEKPPSAAAPIRSAGRPPALGFKITIQKKSEASADALDSSAGQSIRSAGQSTRSAGQSTRTQHLVRFINTEICMSADAPTRSAGQPIRTQDLDRFLSGNSKHRNSSVRLSPPAVRVNPIRTEPIECQKLEISTRFRFTLDLLYLEKHYLSLISYFLNTIFYYCL